MILAHSLIIIEGIPFYIEMPMDLEGLVSLGELIEERLEWVCPDA